MRNFETGASTAEVNDLILHAEKTKKVCDERDEIYKTHLEKLKANPKAKLSGVEFAGFYKLARIMYRTDFPENFQKMYDLSLGQKVDFCEYFAEGFEGWKIDHGY